MLLGNRRAYNNCLKMLQYNFKAKEDTVKPKYYILRKKPRPIFKI